MPLDLDLLAGQFLALQLEAGQERESARVT
jgi:hypothetical protein